MHPQVYRQGLTLARIVVSCGAVICKTLLHFSGLLSCRADLLKVRAQAMNPATGKPFYQYSNPWTALADIYRHEGGFAGLYRGVAPTTQRAAVLTATQFATYGRCCSGVLGKA